MELGRLLDFVGHSDELRHLTDILSTGINSTTNHKQGVSGILAVDLSMDHDENGNTTTKDVLLRPLTLTKPQKEWLLETEWAQRAFISSYMLGVVDNPKSFEHVHTLNLARISSRYITDFSRDDFWDSLPQLQNVTILALPEWRRVIKDQAGYIEATRVVPSSSSLALEALLINIIAPRRQITRLNIGWASGGERATGVCGRNQHLMPAPVMPLIWLATDMTKYKVLVNEMMILFPSVQHLTLTNCWILPTILALLIKNNTKALQTLTLDSVSLSSHIGQSERMLLMDDPRAHITPVELMAGPQRTAPVTSQSAHANRRTTTSTRPIPPGQPVNGGSHSRRPQQTLPRQMRPRQQTRPRQPDFTNNPTVWRAGIRVGSWPWLIDLISPGTRLHHLIAQPKAPKAPSEYSVTTSTLRSITFESCGYAKVDYARAVGENMETNCIQRSGSHAVKRSGRYVADMQATSDRGLGFVSQHMHPKEIQTLQAVWGCWMGWDDDEARQAVFYDGFLPGGTGRFSGTIDETVRTCTYTRQEYEEHTSLQKNMA
jgi:hypothetical protein